MRALLDQIFATLFGWLTEANPKSPTLAQYTSLFLDMKASPNEKALWRARRPPYEEWLPENAAKRR